MAITESRSTEPRHILDISDLTTTEVKRILAIAEDLKSRLRAGHREPLLTGRMLALIFEKQSLRTRVSFETLMAHLGGSSLYLGDDVGFGRREPMCDFGRVLSEMVDCVAVRAKRHEAVVELAKYSTIPVINALTDEAHPCQALADAMTLRERFGEDLSGRTCAWIGDGNNVARSLALICGRLAMRFAMGTPAKYQFSESTMAFLKQAEPSLELCVYEDPRDAVRNASAVCTDVWVSMGQETERAERLADFQAYRVTPELMRLAADDAVFMHCLPAHRTEEVAPEVIDGPRSVVVQEAGNRLHAQKGLVAWLLPIEKRTRFRFRDGDHQLPGQTSPRMCRQSREREERIRRKKRGEGRS
ncbi:MAG: ornithine carbamoyltransferase [Planctomycetia bacterium]|nr:ornithine carbamoyltransferase [Planctomycetia bacterium]